jgi:hypothetical protein
MTHPAHCLLISFTAIVRLKSFAGAHHSGIPKTAASR